jgi:thiamine biosynthesis lipoprotein
VTPLIGRTLERAGYDATYSFISRPQEPVPDWDEVMQWQARTVTTTTPLLLDFGAAGKGYLVDLLTALLHQAGIGQFVIDGSGDLYVHDDVPQRVGLEDPSDPTQVVGIVEVSGASLCASAGNRRSWGEGMHHIINPQTQRPVQDITATWTIASTAAQADGLATALFFVSPQQLLAEFTFQYVRLFRNGTIEYSNDLQGEIFS